MHVLARTDAGAAGAKAARRRVAVVQLAAELTQSAAGFACLMGELVEPVAAGAAISRGRRPRDGRLVHLDLPEGGVALRRGVRASKQQRRPQCGEAPELP